MLQLHFGIWTTQFEYAYIQIKNYMFCYMLLHLVIYSWQKSGSFTKLQETTSLCNKRSHSEWSIQMGENESCNMLKVKTTSRSNPGLTWGLALSPCRPGCACQSAGDPSWRCWRPGRWRWPGWRTRWAGGPRPPPRDTSTSRYSAAGPGTRVWWCRRWSPTGTASRPCWAQAPSRCRCGPWASSACRRSGGPTPSAPASGVKS